MTTTDTVLLIVLTSILSLFFLLCCVAVALIIRVLTSVRRVVKKADGLIDSVESAADVIKDAGGGMAVLKLIKNITDMTGRRK